jgi:hypothetical protein
VSKKNLEKLSHINEEKMHKKKLLLTTGFTQTFIQNEIQKSKSQVEEAQWKVHRRGDRTESKLICFIEHIN